MKKQHLLRIIAFTMALMLTLCVAASALAAYKTIPYGEQSDNVRQMQNALKNKGYYSGAVDGKFGPQTLRAVRNYQSAIGITADGKPGNKTLTALYNGTSAINETKDTEKKQSIKVTNPRTLYYGCTGARVRGLQRALKNLKFYNGTVDGVFGDLTEAAVRKYQSAKGLHVDGIAGTRTIASLNKNSKYKIYTSFILDVGSTGNEVRRLQSFLRTENFPPDGDSAGTFGSGTQQAVRDWQDAMGLNVTGTVTESQYNDIVLGRLSVNNSVDP